MSPVVLLVLAVASLLCGVAGQATINFGLCYQATSLPNSPYGPWAVSISALLTMNATAVNTSTTSSGNGGSRFGYGILGATGTRTQLNSDGSTTTSTLGLCVLGTQGSGQVIYPNAPYTDWNGYCLSVLSSSPTPVQGVQWLVYPNGFPTQGVEIYYDLPAYSYPIEYHSDNTTGTMSITQGNPTAPPSCPTPALPTPTVSTMTWQFCYQAAFAGNSTVSAYQVATQGTFLTNTTSTPGGPLQILRVTGQRKQSVAGAATPADNIAGQGFTHTPGDDGNELGADSLLWGVAPHLDAAGILLAFNARVTIATGTLPTDNGYALVSEVLMSSPNGAVIESNTALTPDWSSFAIVCTTVPFTCPLVSSASAATTDRFSGSFSNSASTCTTNSPNAAAPQQQPLSSITSLAAVAALAGAALFAF